MRIGPRLGLGFGMVLLLLCAVVAVALSQLGALAGNAMYYADNLVPSYEIQHRAAMALGTIRRLESQHILSSSPADMDDIEKRIAEQHRTLADEFAAYAKNLLSDDADRRALERVKADVEAYAAQWPTIRDLSRQTVQDPTAQEKARQALMGPSREAYRKADESFSQWWAYNVRLAGERKAESIATQGQARWALLGGAALALALGVIAAAVITRSITTPIGRAVRVAETVAEGDLSQHVQFSGKDECAQLLQALARMSARLAELVQQVRGGSESIAAGSQQIAVGSTDLSQRTEKQAANLEETAASMEELSATVRHNADTAQQAAQLASAASAAAREGGESVAVIVQTMQEISVSSNRITDIIGTIDGIAFQTNILALNAAVEAARAGEQGRGFAVVAGEVRTLAQRSAEAAREIKALIQDSTGKVEAGSRLVDEAGGSIADLVTKVQRVSDLLDEISSASGEQTKGIGQVSEAVSQLDEVTQQNAALVEESSAAADSLSAQAQRLAELVRFFKVEPGLSAQPAGATPAALAQATIAQARARSAGAAQARPPRPVAAAPADDDGWQSFH
ncbi:methyl-accepting chemotaxis protein [Azohydromonas aeria]|uniref:methyl-accepting chemotaxis protein n=1 Tax=Azohydromonas aeria TaxID=2590212 RepID=UPI001E56890D|nr:methyl-accepting chemotaxis protein [Azohydromonas aeria]